VRSVPHAYKRGDRVWDRDLGMWGTVEEVRPYGDPARGTSRVTHLVRMDAGGMLVYLSGDGAARLHDMGLHSLLGVPLEA